MKFNYQALSWELGDWAIITAFAVLLTIKLAGGNVSWAAVMTPFWIGPVATYLLYPVAIAIYTWKTTRA